MSLYNYSCSQEEVTSHYSLNFLHYAHAIFFGGNKTLLLNWYSKISFFFFFATVSNLSLNASSNCVALECKNFHKYVSFYLSSFKKTVPRTSMVNLCWKIYWILKREVKTTETLEGFQISQLCGYLNTWPAKWGNQQATYTKYIHKTKVSRRSRFL